jgi:peptidoglycan glycosyltransferase
MSELEKLGKRGSIVALDVNTGAVLAMASTPTYDLNNVSTNWEQIIDDPGKPLLNRATQGLYTPGSSFKLIATAAALESGSFHPDSKFQDDDGYIIIDGNRINNWRETPFGPHDFGYAVAQSINTTFAQIGDQLGESKLVEYQQKFGLYDTPPLELPPGEVLPSGRYVDGELASPDAPMDRVQVAWMAIGQENVQVTPLQMALIAQAIGNDGKMMKPYVVDSVSDYNGTIIKQTRPEQWKQPIRSDTASAMTDMMIKVVNEGTGLKAKTPKVQIAGKTGTAEVSSPNPNAWFVGFAPADNPKVAIAVVVEDSDKGGGLSGPAAMETILAALGLPPGA